MRSRHAGGGGEALVHLRRTLEAAASEMDGEAVAILDLDLRNAFPSFTWRAVREAVRAWAPELRRWTEWSHAAEARIR